MDWSYLATPLLAWFVAGMLKFAINSLRARRLAFDLIGYGGLPSNHSAIVSSMAALIGLKEGIAQPAFGVALTLALIVIMDAHSLRRQVGRHAEAINKMAQPASANHLPLRERMGHSRVEIAAGILVGIAAALAVRHFL
ncbi:MAG TPA: divergent PAP2 family protein [Bordetella sp.]